MPTHGRIPRTRHLFPEAAAWILQSRRAALHSTRRLRRAIGVLPLWLVSACAGVTSLGLTCVLFFLAGPLPAAAPVVAPVVKLELPPVSTVPARTVPVPESYLAASFPNLIADLEWTRLPDGWNRERELTSSAHAPLQRVSYSQLAPGDWWRTSVAHSPVADSFQRYLPAHNLLAAVEPPQAADFAPTADSTGDLGMGVLVRKSMPAQVDNGKIFTYEITIQNASGGQLDDVVVRESVSALDRVEQVHPPADIEGDELVWKLGELRPSDVRVLRVTINLDQRREVRTETRVIPRSRLAAAVAVSLPPPQVIAKPAPRPAAPAPVEIPREPKLELTYTPVTSVKTGEILSLRFTVKNVGNAPAEDIRLYVQLSGEFQHRFGDYIQNEVKRLAPGESHTAQLRALVKAVGDGRLDASLTMRGSRETDRQLRIPVQPSAVNKEQAGPLPSEALRPTPEFEDSLAWLARK